jgi:hypothetical protein
LEVVQPSFNICRISTFLLRHELYFALVAWHQSQAANSALPAVVGPTIQWCASASRRSPGCQPVTTGAWLISQRNAGVDRITRIELLGRQTIAVRIGVPIPTIDLLFPRRPVRRRPPGRKSPAS